MKYKRLNFIANQVRKDEKVLDIGTDHAIVPILLLENGITKNILASDINTEPLTFAKDNLKSKKMDDKVKLLLMDGIKDIEPNEYDVIIIAGMGGQTISNILKQKKFNGRYILHPTTDIVTVRKTIQKLKMKITNEWVICEGKVYNVIIEAKKGNESLTEKELFLGPILMKEKNTNKYYQYLLDIFERNVKLSRDSNLKLKERKWLKEKLEWSEKN
ncbi:MAG: SAM-dependent methyltransferase [Mycoplasmataceae bacterium]|nr:SAM-dependent methyltransferase [Mycoplasmataceae bacterium]